MAARAIAGPGPGTSVSRLADADLPAISGHQPALDGMRVIAAFAVLVTHVGGETGLSFNGSPLSFVVTRGDVGVPVFFTLSGLLLYRPWARTVLQSRKVPKTGTYLWRRALRILPAYWAVVALALILMNPGHRGSPVTWLQYLTLSQIYDPHPWWPGTGADGLAQTWSLAVEVSFYALLPLIAALLAKIAGRAPDPDARARRLLITIALLAASSYVFTVAGYPQTLFWLGDTLPRLITWFAPGMALAVVSVWAHADTPAAVAVRRFCRTVAFSGGTCWLIAGVLFVLCCTTLVGPEAIGIPTLWQFSLKTGIYNVIATLVVAPAAFQPARPTRLSTVLGNPVMSFLGKVSYGVFLWQFLVIAALFAVFHVRTVFSGGSFTLLTDLVALITVSVVTVAISTLSYYLLEEPATRLQVGQRRAGQRRAGRRRRAEAADAAAAGHGYQDGAAYQGNGYPGGARYRDNGTPDGAYPGRAVPGAGAYPGTGTAYSGSAHSGSAHSGSTRPDGAYPGAGRRRRGYPDDAQRDGAYQESAYSERAQREIAQREGAHRQGGDRNSAHRDDAQLGDPYAGDGHTAYSGNGRPGLGYPASADNYPTDPGSYRPSRDGRYRPGPDRPLPRPPATEPVSSEDVAGRRRAADPRTTGLRELDR